MAMFWSLAKVAGDASRFAESAEFIKRIAELNLQLTEEERELLSLSYENVMATHVASWKNISKVIQEEEDKLNSLLELRSMAEERGNSLLELRSMRFKAEEGAYTACKEVLLILDKLIPSSSAEATRFYLKMKEKFHGHLARFYEELRESADFSRRSCVKLLAGDENDPVEDGGGREGGQPTEHDEQATSGEDDQDVPWMPRQIGKPGEGGDNNEQPTEAEDGGGRDNQQRLESEGGDNEQRTDKQPEVEEDDDEAWKDVPWVPREIVKPAAGEGGGANREAPGGDPEVRDQPPRAPKFTKILVPTDRKALQLPSSLKAKVLPPDFFGKTNGVGGKTNGVITLLDDRDDEAWNLNIRYKSNGAKTQFYISGLKKVWRKLGFQAGAEILFYEGTKKLNYRIAKKMPEPLQD